MRTGVCVLARKIMQAMTGGRAMSYILQIRSYGFDKVIFIVWIKCFLFKKHFWKHRIDPMTFLHPDVF